MKFFGLSTIVAMILLSTLQVGVVSCTKETLIRDTVIVRDTLRVKETITIRDTLRITDTTLNAQILTSHPWKLQELRGVYANRIEYYVRGGSNNTQNYDNEYILFRSDKTGTYVDPSGRSYNINWELVQTPRIKLTYNILNLGSEASTLITWENIVYKNGTISYDEYFTQGSNNSHMQGIRIRR